MATTPNYGWVTPAPTDFVTDLPADFEIFADAVDETVKDLNPGTTAGDLDYYTSSTEKARLAIGTAGQVLKVNSGATAPEWGTISGGGMTLLATATPSAATTLSFTSIPTTHKHLKLIWLDVTQSANGAWFARFNNDNTSTYMCNGRANTSATTTTLSTWSYPATYVGGAQIWQYTIVDTSFGSGYTGSGELNIYRYAELEDRRFSWQTYGINDAPYARSCIGDGTYESSAAAITSIDFTRSSTQTITGKFYLYGVD